MSLSATLLFHSIVSPCSILTLAPDRFRRQAHVTPKSFLSFLTSFQSVYTQQYRHYDEQANRMDGGLKKLVEAKQSVEELSKELMVKEKELDVANKEAEEVLETVRGVWWMTFLILSDAIGVIYRWS